MRFRSLRRLSAVPAASVLLSAAAQAHPPVQKCCAEMMSVSSRPMTPIEPRCKSPPRVLCLRGRGQLPNGGYRSVPSVSLCRFCSRQVKISGKKVRPLT